jgi:hypothetical protein
MNKKSATITVSVFVLALVSLLPALAGAGAAGNAPLAISPGGGAEVATILQGCPTFSWSAVDYAAGYRLAVFQSPTIYVTSYEEMAANGTLVVNKEISGPALSWTPSAEESLQNGSTYAWYVQALDGAGNALGPWSGGRLFRVRQ